MSATLRWIFAFIAAIALAGCATTYGPARLGKVGGYEETQLAPGRYEVFAAANGPAGRFSGTMAMYRAAEIAIDQGYSHFAVVSATGAERYVGYGSPTGFAGDEARIVIVLQNDAAAPVREGAFNPRVFEAVETIARLQPEIDKRQ